MPRMGTVASDGPGRNSPYSADLLRYLEKPRLELGHLFCKVRDAVPDATGDRQEPFTYGLLSSQSACPSVPPQVVAAAPSSGENLAATNPSATDRLRTEEQLFQDSIGDSYDSEDIRVYQGRNRGGCAGDDGRNARACVAGRRRKWSSLPNRSARNGRESRWARHRRSSILVRWTASSDWAPAARSAGRKGPGEGRRR